MMDQYKRVRGGSWLYAGAACRSAIRLNIGPGSRNNDLGFRVIREEPYEAWLLGGPWDPFGDFCRSGSSYLDVGPGFRFFDGGFRVICPKEEV